MTMRKNAIENIVKQVKQKRMIKRAIALLSVVVILVTFNSTKFMADTLEHFTDCGYNYDHQHGPECYDASGELVCQLHVHTDTCYQTRPASDTPETEEAASDPATEGIIETVDTVETVEEEAASAPVEAVFEPVEEAVSEQLEEAVEEVDVQLGEGEEDTFELAPEDIELESREFEPEPEELPLYYVGEQYPFFLSDVLAGCGMDIPLGDVVEIGQVLNADDASQTLSFERIEDDYAIYPTQNCEDQELAMITTTGLMTVRLIEAVVPQWAKAEQAAEPEVTKIEENEEATDPEEAVETVKTEEVEETKETEKVEEVEEAAETETEPTEETEKDEKVEEAAVTETEEAEETEKEEIVEEAAMTETEEAEETEKVESVEETEKIEETENTEVVEEVAGTEKGEAIEEAAETETEEAEETEKEEIVEEAAVTETEEAEETEKEEIVEEAAVTETEPTEETEKVEKVEEDAEAETEQTEENKESEEAAKAEDETKETEETVEAEDETEATEEDAKAEDETVAPAEDEGADTEAVVAEAGIPENRTLIIDLAQVERYPLSLNAMLAHFQPAQETVVTTENETEPEESEKIEESPVEAAPVEEAVSEVTDELSDEMSEDAVVEDVEVESEAVEASVDEVEFELGEEPVADDEIEVVDIVEKAALPHIEYDNTLLSVEDAGNDYLITPVASFDSTSIVVEQTYTILLLNSQVAEEDAAAVAMPAQSFEGMTETMTVKVEAEEGAFPEGTTMSLEEIDDEDTLTGINNAATEEAFVEVQRVHAVDITFRDADGNEIEPLIPISVVMSIRETEQDEDTVVVHMDDAGNAEVVQDVVNIATKAVTEEAAEETAVEEAAEIQPAEAPVESVSFVSDTFSVYAVVVTKKLETKTLDPATGETYKITVTYTEDAAIPVGATLDVSEIEGDKAQAYLAQAVGAMEEGRQIALARFFDIRIMDGETEIQPAAPVLVTAELVNDEETDLTAASTCAVHFAGDEPDEPVKAAGTIDAVTFKAEGFSVWGVVYTVDFHWEVNGGTYDFSIPGGGFISFEHLVEALGLGAGDADVANEADADETAIDGAEASGGEEAAEAYRKAISLNEVPVSEATRQFVAGVERVEFSTPSLVWVGKADADMTISAMKKQYGIECE